MITIIEGIPGSGKTYYAVKTLVEGEYYYYDKVYTNIKLNLPYIKLKYPELYKRLDFITAEEIENLGEWAKNKSNCLLILDEIQIYYNSREWQRRNREFLEFLTQHRKQGIDLWAITQDKKNIDTQFRRLAGIIIQCVNASQLEVFIFRLPNFFIVKKFSGGVRAGTEFFKLNKKVALAYDTFARVDMDNEKAKAKKLPFGLRLRRAIVWHKFARFVSYLIVAFIIWFKYGHFFHKPQKKPLPKKGVVARCQGVVPGKAGLKDVSIINSKPIYDTLQPKKIEKFIRGVITFPDGSKKFLLETIKEFGEEIEKSYKWLEFKPLDKGSDCFIDYSKKMLVYGKEKFYIGGFL
ncbi:zonular occludens toxin domain-containing protein [Caminibacter sp.]